MLILRKFLIKITKQIDCGGKLNELIYNKKHPCEGLDAKHLDPTGMFFIILKLFIFYYGRSCLKYMNTPLNNVATKPIIASVVFSLNKSNLPSKYTTRLITLCMIIVM